MYREGTLKKLKVKVLDLYVMKRKLKHSRGAIKQEKIDLVTIGIAKIMIEGSKVLDESDCDDDVDDDVDNHAISFITFCKISPNQIFRKPTVYKPQQ